MQDNQRKYYLCERNEALKEVSDYISDLKKEIEAVKNRRLRALGTSATVLGVALGLAILSDVGASPSIRVGAFMSAGILVGAVDNNIARANHNNKNLLKAAYGFRAYIQENTNDKLDMPVDFEDFLNEIVEDNLTTYKTLKDRMSLTINGVTTIISAISVAFASAGDNPNQYLDRIFETIIRPDSINGESGRRNISSPRR